MVMALPGGAVASYFCKAEWKCSTEMLAQSHLKHSHIISYILHVLWQRKRDEWHGNQFKRWPNDGQTNLC